MRPRAYVLWDMLAAMAILALVAAMALGGLAALRRGCATVSARAEATLRLVRALSRAARGALPCGEAGLACDLIPCGGESLVVVRGEAGAWVVAGYAREGRVWP